MRTTNNNIQKLKKNEIFVFGSNESGKHGKGAAKLAMKWGAKWNVAEGLQGSTYAIPTKDKSIKNTLKLSEIEKYVDSFVNFATHNVNLTFMVTEIGCGLAGLKPIQIAPLFRDCINVKNIYLPERFWEVLNELYGKYKIEE